MPKGASNVQRTLRYLEQKGCITGIVERFNRFVGAHGIRQDLFGIFDLISITPTGICGVQVCGPDFAAHDRKILASEIAPEWINVGGDILLIGWRKVKLKRGGKAMRWKPRIKEYSEGDFNG
jgi:hypothetical protein